MILLNWNTVSQIALLDAVVSNLLLAGASLVVAIALRFYRPSRQLFLYVLIICVAISGLWSALVKFGLQAVVQSPEYTILLEKSFSIRFSVALLIIGGMAMMSLLWYNLAEAKKIEQRKADAEKLAKDAELHRLQQQMQPHFLFNSLNSISALAGSKPEQARKMIEQLGDFLRGTLKKSDDNWSSFHQELENLRLYLEIEKVRFSHRLHVQIDVHDDMGSLIIPPFLLQPIVENAIKFGLYDTTEKIEIQITAVKKGNDLQVSVKNPFDAETANAHKGTGFGLSAIRRRLYLIFGRSDLLSTEASDNHFTATVLIPQNHEGSGH